VPAITGGWNLKSLAAGLTHVCGILLADSSARCWGARGYDDGQATVPAITGGWKSLAAG
jgi:hypothetical protein